MPKADLEAGTKVCSSAGCRHVNLPQPLSAFSKDSTRADGYCNNCRECHSRRKKEEREQRNAGAEYRRSIAVAKARQEASLMRIESLKEAAESASGSHLNQLVCAIARQSGGPDRLAKEFLELIQDPRTKDAHRISGYKTLFTLLVDHARLHPPKKDFSDFTDDELKSQIKRVVDAMDKQVTDVEFNEISGPIVDQEIEEDGKP